MTQRITLEESGGGLRIVVRTSHNRGRGIDSLFLWNRRKVESLYRKLGRWLEKQGASA